MPKKVATIDTVFSIDGIGTVIALPKEDQWALDPPQA
jgi:predicted tellurium resistance membrane protein TerC